MRRTERHRAAGIATSVFLATFSASILAGGATDASTTAIVGDERSNRWTREFRAYQHNPDGVFRYDIFDETAGKVSVAGSTSIVIGRYRAYFGQGPAAVYRIDSPHKERRLMHTSPDLIGEELDMSRSYEERWEGPDTRVIRHLGVAGERKDHVIRRTLTRVPAAPSELDGVFRLEVVDVSDGVPLPGEQILLRYGDYIGFFRQEHGKPLHAVYAREVEPNQFQVLFSTRDEDSDKVLDLSTDHEGAFRDAQWVESYLATGDFVGTEGHRIQRVFTRMPE